MIELELESKDIASYVVKYCAKANYFINLTKLQKLVFCCYGVALAYDNIRICREHPKAWDHGPVFPQVYKITSKNRDGFVQMLLEYPDKCLEKIPAPVLEIINKCLNVFGKYNAGQLVAWSHREEGPWNTSIKKNGMYKNMDDEAICEYFAKYVVTKD